MSSVQDHPDIEKIAADTDGVIDGIPVRETIREIFRNPENGTPDNISKAGCLALALKSNEVGERDKGYVVWNAWRDMFPVSASERTPRNRANFDEVNFAEGLSSKITFKRFHFGRRTSFKRVVFPEKISFMDANFGDNSTFHQAKFLGKTYFQSSAQREQKGFLRIRFSGCHFAAMVNFSNRSFLSSLSFKGSTFDVFPVFHGCEMHQDTSFEGAVFPEAKGNEEAARAYRTLKLAFSKQQAIREEQRFSRLEMAEEAMGHQNKAKQALREFKLLTGLREGFTWVLYKAYSVLSDYGFSVARPLVLLVAAWLVFAAIYGSYSSGQAVCMVWQAGCDLQTDWLNFSLQQALPLPGFDKLDHTIKGVAVGWLFLHKTISLAALFLIGLALRNLFKLK